MDVPFRSDSALRLRTDHATASCTISAHVVKQRPLSRVSSTKVAYVVPKEGRARRDAGLSEPNSVLRVRRISVRLAHYNVRALRHARSVWVVDDHMDRSHCDTAAAGAGTRWGDSAVADLFVQGDRADPGHQDGRVGRRVVAHCRSSDTEPQQTCALRVR